MPHDDVPAALQALADELGVSGEVTLPAQAAPPLAPVGPADAREHRRRHGR
jgi:hypothetical protein